LITPNPDKPEQKSLKKLNFLKPVAKPLYKRFCEPPAKYFLAILQNLYIPRPDCHLWLSFQEHLISSINYVHFLYSFLNTFPLYVDRSNSPGSCQMISGRIFILLLEAFS